MLFPAAGDDPAGSLGSPGATEQISPARRRELARKITRYFFINPAEIVGCPFLQDRECLIYPARFFGCRAYGLWTEDHYRQTAQQARRLKKNVVQLWKKLGVALPEEVIGHQPAYCAAVETLGPGKMSDAALLQAADRVDAWSQELNPGHFHFQEGYFRDLSFLTAGLFFELSEAVRLKFTIVRELLQSGNPEPLERVLARVPDLFDL